MPTFRAIEFTDRLSPEKCAANPTKVYLFGDNLEGWGKAGQACIRGCPNAHGVPTKKFPGLSECDYFFDDAYESNCTHIQAAFDELECKFSTMTVVIPASGLGTGLAKMPIKAPKTYLFLLKKIVELAEKCDGNDSVRETEGVV